MGRWLSGKANCTRLNLVDRSGREDDVKTARVIDLSGQGHIHAGVFARELRFARDLSPFSNCFWLAG